MPSLAIEDPANTSQMDSHLCGLIKRAVSPALRTEDMQSEGEEPHTPTDAQHKYTKNILIIYKALNKLATSSLSVMASASAL